LATLASAYDSSSPPPRLIEALRRRFSVEETAALLTTVQLRRRATAKFPAAAQMFFTEAALEQATAATVAAHRAEAIHRRAPPGPVLDLGCGIGGDTLALARHRPVIAFELDPVRAAIAQANAAAVRPPFPVTVHCADWTALAAAGALPAAAAIFVDPARRDEGRRIFDPAGLIPPLATILALAAPLLAVKLMPGLPHTLAPPDCSLEFVSHAGVCKEAVLWRVAGLGAATGAGAAVHTHNGWLHIAADGIRPPVGPLSDEAIAAGLYLHEADGAVIRAGALGPLARKLGGAWLLDAEIAYLLTGWPLPEPEPLVQSFVIDELHPFHLKRLNGRLQALAIGTVELKKRGSAVEPEALRPRLKLVKGGRSATVFFTQRQGHHLMLIGRRLTARAAAGESGDADVAD
jgi:SAM-dependent methyltransferase